MTRRVNILVSVALSFMFLFMTVGFAALTDNLTITGKVKVDIPSGLFIVDITESKKPSGLDKATYGYIGYSTTIDTTLSKSSDRTAGSVTYTVTVYNNTKYEYAYRGLYYQSNLSGYNNNLVSTSNGNRNIGVVVSFPNGRIVAPNEELQFTVTYTLGSDRNTFPARNDYKNLLNFQFGINVESQAAAIDAVHDKFLNILNTKTTYDELVNKLDDKFDGSQEWTSNYIGNVSDAVDADSMTVETLFAGQLNMVINGVVTPATVLIKHENLDNNPNTGDSYTIKYNNSSTPTTYSGCEMTLYLTTDPLTKANGQAPVYVTVFTCDRDENGNIISDWYKVGDTYVGKAPIVGYKGESGGTGSFVTDNWVADRATYTPVTGYSYNVTQGTTIKDLTRVVDQNTIKTFQKLLNEGKAMIDDLTYAGTGITIVEEAYSAASRYFTLDANGNPVANSNVTRVQLIPVMTNLDYALVEAQKAINALK
ncbi:MAG: hypothetical protein J6V80_03365 [Clostridia bacterium]|nr:hypothetical protein [Clostridia bacterium]